MSAQKTPPEAKVERYPNGWHLVEAGSWQVSVGPDGLLMLPRHLKPEEVEEFCAAALAAADVGTKVRAENAEKAGADDRSPSPRRAMVREGGVPQGAARMMVTPGPNTPVHRSSIGRGRAQHGPQPAGTQGPPVRTRGPRPHQ